MFNRHIHVSFVVLGFLALLNRSEFAQSEDYQIELTFDQFLTSGGQIQYSVRAGFQRDEASNRLVAPNGHVFDYQNQYARPLTTFPQFTTTAFGEWSAETASSSIRFQVDAVPQDSAAFKSPVINSPIPGSEVPKVFTVDWQGESRGFAEVAKRTNVASLSSFHPDECCSTTFNVKLLGGGTGKLELDVWTRTILPEPQIVSQFPVGNDTYSFFASIRSHAPPATYTILPEPRTFVLAVAGLGLITIRRR